MPVDQKDVTPIAHAADRAESHAFSADDALDLLDWKRRIFALYEEVRAATDPEIAWNRWREVREDLYRTHPQSPLPPERREAYGDPFFPYDSTYRVVAEIADADPRSSASPIPASTGGRSRSAGSASPASRLQAGHTSWSCTGTRLTAAASSSP
jgi:hypothetical protein